MSVVDIRVTDGRSGFEPGEEIAGTVAWQLDDPAESMELQLLWTTRGKGNVDTHVVGSMEFDAPGDRDERPFAFRLPAFPYSFTGKLIELVWALRLLVRPQGLQTQRNLTVAPGRGTIDLYGPAAEQ